MFDYCPVCCKKLIGEMLNQRCPKEHYKELYTRYDTTIWVMNEMFTHEEGNPIAKYFELWAKDIYAAIYRARSAYRKENMAVRVTVELMEC
jgi:hypothetical protein